MAEPPIPDAVVPLQLEPHAGPQHDAVLADVIASERHFRLLYDHNPAMYFTLSPDGMVRSVNRYGAEQLGYDPEDLVGRSVLAVFKPEDHHTVLSQLASCTASPGRLFEWEIEKVRKNATFLWVKERAQAIKDPFGRDVVLVVCEDITARRLTEEIVRDSEERWRAMFERAGVGIAQLGLDGEFLRVNPRLCETLGYAAQTLVQRTFQDLTHPDDRERSLASFRDLRSGSRTSSSMETRYRRSDEAWIWVHTTMSLVRSSRGAPSHYIIVVEDISERKRSEEALRESEQAIRSLQEAISAPGLTFDQRMQTVLELGRRRFKLPIGALTKLEGDHLEVTHVDADDRSVTVGTRLPLCQTVCRETLTADDALCFEQADAAAECSRPGYLGLGLECYIGTKVTGFRRVHGTMCFMGRQPYPERFTSADKDFLLLMARWVGGELDRKDAEHALKEQESLLRSVIDTATDSIFMKDREGRYRFINQAGASVMGLRPEEVVGKTDLDLFPRSTAMRLMADDGEVLNGAEQRRFERLIPEAGRARTYYSIKTPHRDREGGIVGLVGVSRDMTEAKRAEEALRLTQIAVDRAADLAFWITPDAKFLYVNDAACDRLGYTRAELLSMTVADIDPDARPDHWTLHWDQLRTKGQLRFEARHRTKSGELYPVEVVANYVAVDQHEYNFVFARDISDRKRSYSLLEAAMNSVDDGLLIVDLHGNITGMNHRCMELWAMPPEFAKDRTSFLTFAAGRLRDPDVFMKRIHELSRHPDGESFDVLEFTDGRVFERYSRPQVLDHRIVGRVWSFRDVTARKRSEEALRASEERFAKAFRSSPHPMLITELETGRCVEVNEASLQLFGFTREELLGHTTVSLGLWPAPEDRQDFVRRLRSTGSLRNVPLSLSTKDRTPKQCLVSSELIEVDGKQCIVTVGTDLTELRRAERALQSSEDLFAKAFRSSPYPIVISELASGRCLDANEAAMSLFGSPPDAAAASTSGRPVSWPPADDRADFIGRLESSGSVRNLEVSLRDRAGRLRRCLISAERIDLMGTPCMVTIANDITEQKEAEAALKASEARLQRFVSEAPVGLMILDNERRLLTANKAFCQLTGYDEHELIGQTYELYTHPHDWPRNRSMTEDFYSGVRSDYTIEKRYVRKSRDVIWVSVKATGIELPSHPGPLLLAVVQDITDQKRATEERERLSQDLHDNILQSLYAVGMQLEASRLAAGTSARKSKVYIGQAIDQLNHLVGDIRHFIALLKRGTAHQTDFREALNQLVSAFSAAGHRPPELKIHDGVLSSVTAEQAEQLLNIAREALSNSVRHSRATHRSISLVRMGRFVRMQICDNGIGFVPRRSQKRGHGLANMAARAKKIGARLRLNSGPDLGTCVTVDLAMEPQA
ncbi:MAG TPA: PAS domain S-box protein [Nitrospira sp.]|nr:PAS domain S-box protein [Nitrospira sp.]